MRTVAPTCFEKFPSRAPRISSSRTPSQGKSIYPFGHSRQLCAAPSCATEPTGKLYVWWCHDSWARPPPRSGSNMEFSRGKHISTHTSPCNGSRFPPILFTFFGVSILCASADYLCFLLPPQSSSSVSSPTSSHRQALTPSPSPPSYAPLPETTSHTTTRGRSRHHTHPTTNLPPLPLHPRTPAHTQPHHHGHRQQASPPLTPPTFDARNASAKLKSIDGYVSFANVEGLGGPPGVDENATEEEKRRGSWWPWRGRERSGSLGTAP